MLSKLEPITYVFTYIFINCSAIYGYNVMTGVIVLFIALWGLSNKHKMLFYPAKFKLNNYVPVPTKDFNLYQSEDNPRSNCYDKPTEDNPILSLEDLLENLKGEKSAQSIIDSSGGAGGAQQQSSPQRQQSLQQPQQQEQPQQQQQQQQPQPKTAPKSSGVSGKAEMVGEVLKIIALGLAGILKAVSGGG